MSMDDGGVEAGSALPAGMPAEVAAAPARVGGLAFMLRALRHRNYRLFFIGQGTSLVGSWLTRVATSWLVYRLTPDKAQAAWLLGVVNFAGLLPTFALAPVTGVLADRWDRHTILVVTQMLSLLQSAALAVLALGGYITVPQVVLLQVFQGLVNAFDVPARQAFVVDMVERREDLSNAIALNSSMFNGARLIGPAVGGVLIAELGEGICFLVDAISYIAVVAALLMMDVRRNAMRKPPKHVLHELKDGVAYVFGFAPIRTLLMLVAVTSLMSVSYQVLMPIFAARLWPGHGAQMLGILMASVGVGSLIGALYLASRRSVLGLGNVLTAASGLFGCGLIAFALLPHVAAAIPLMFVCGFGMIVHFASSNTVIQTIVDDDKRGRVMSFFTMAVMGMAPFGSLLSGWMASRWGEPTAVAVSGTCCVVAAALFFLKLPSLRVLVRPIYVRKGIIPQVSDTLRQANPAETTPRR